MLFKSVKEEDNKVQEEVLLDIFTSESTLLNTSYISNCLKLQR